MTASFMKLYKSNVVIEVVNVPYLEIPKMRIARSLMATEDKVGTLNLFSMIN